MNSDKRIKLFLLAGIAFMLFNFPIIGILDKQATFVGLYYFFFFWLILIVVTYWLVEGKRN